ncbi:hydroxyethylthiazole kinase [Teichococcus rhizosphaerae]|uniref:hydroxyethylthiazole kinase n=1 Tax=Teichococcus rhizosphaerae TaxID=1335062 RepID=UPI001FE90DB7|nr:hydroxyethylthiazole kinase [Pseudoroseomonas rhizosphaerae]
MPDNTATELAAQAAAALERLRQAAPLVHNITNVVVANVTANALLAAGASPAMVQAAEEVADFAPRAAALVVNIGTLSVPQLRAMRLAVPAARAAGRPWVLDPVAAGATPFRLAAAREMAALRPDVLRGNASEILALAGEDGAASRGVDSAHPTAAAHAAAARLARSTGATVAVTGAVDHVTNGERAVAVANGHPLLTRVTGMGCTATALIGAFLGAGLPPMEAATAGLALLGVAAERAAAEARGPGSFQVALLDALHGLRAADLAGAARLAPVPAGG